MHGPVPQVDFRRVEARSEGRSGLSSCSYSSFSKTRRLATLFAELGDSTSPVTSERAIANWRLKSFRAAGHECSALRKSFSLAGDCEKMPSGCRLRWSVLVEAFEASSSKVDGRNSTALVSAGCTSDEIASRIELCCASDCTQTYHHSDHSTTTVAPA